MPDTTLTSAELDELERLAKAATPGDLDTVNDPPDEYGGKSASDYYDCPCCQGTSTVDGVTYANFDGVAMGVQFFGIGNEHKNYEAFFRAANPAAILRLLSLARAGLEAGKAEESMRERAADLGDLEKLVRVFLDNNPDELVADSGETVLDLFRYQARAALAAHGGWQPIETAPEDGTVILVYRQDAGVFTAHFVEEDAHLSNALNPPEGDCFWFTTSGEDLTGDKPTHWRPLPAPPAIRALPLTGDDKP